jgi:hypothetical protein
LVVRRMACDWHLRGSTFDRGTMGMRHLVAREEKVNLSASRPNVALSAGPAASFRECTCKVSHPFGRVQLLGICC